jgi:hypothetical protein
MVRVHFAIGRRPSSLLRVTFILPGVVMKKMADKKKNLLLPYYVWDIGRFLLCYQALRLYDRVKIVLNILLRWLLVFGFPLYVWIFFQVMRYYWGWDGGLVAAVMPLWLGWMPLPFFQPVSGSIFGWAVCILIGIVWLMLGSTALNMMTERGVTYERIEEKWRRACLHVGLTTNVNLEPDKDVREYPPVVSVRPRSFVIQSKGITPETIQTLRTELSAAMGVFLGDVGFLKKSDGSTYADLVELTYVWQDLPGMIPLVSVPVNGNGELVFGLGMDGWFTMPLRDMVHIGVSGATGSGKSVFLRSLITQMMVIFRDAIIIGIDFKGGAEFRMFSKEGLGNFVCITEYEEAVQVLRVAYEEYRRREVMISLSDFDSVYDMYERTGVGVEPLFIVIDEAAEFWDPGKTVEPQARRAANEAFEYIRRLAKLGRFVAIHLIVSTQRATADLIPTQVRSMLLTRVIFKVEQKEDSIAFIGNAAATKLRKADGRCYVQTREGLLKELQVPYVTKEQVRELLLRQPVPLPSELMKLCRQVVKQA